MQGLTTRVRHVLKSDPACRHNPTRAAFRVWQMEGAPIPDDMLASSEDYSRPGDIDRTIRRLQNLGLYPPEDGRGAPHQQGHEQEKASGREGDADEGRHE